MTEKHYCELRVPEVDYPVLKCYEENGFFWETNLSYARKINYCPVCGTKAPKQVKEKND